MSWHPSSAIPSVVVCNISETFHDFLNQADDAATRARLIRERQYKGDRALLWLGGRKLVFTSLPVPHADWLCQRYGYDDTECLAPANPSPWLSLDILREPALVRRLVAYAGVRRTVQLVPYATTREFLHLADTLRREHGLLVLLPESPAPANLWVRDYVDTKGGFRALAGRWLPDAAEVLPDGVACASPRLAAEVVCWFGQRAKPCIVKPDNGENGIGNRVYPPGIRDVDTVERELDDNPFLRGNGLIVEEFVPSRASLSPSVEWFVPRLGEGEPSVTYLSDQVFTASGGFGGVLVGKALCDAPWYPRLADAGRRVAAGLQQMGYVGHFDMDAIVGDDGRMALLEVNSRRTGGTHVHEFARHRFGPDYLDGVVLLSDEAAPSGGITDADTLLGALDGLLYPMRGRQQGVIVSITSSLEAGRFGGIFVGPTMAQVMALQRAVVERIEAVTVPVAVPQA